MIDTGEKSMESGKKEAAKMTIKEMQERKKELGFTYAQIAELSGCLWGRCRRCSAALP